MKALMTNYCHQSGFSYTHIVEWDCGVTGTVINTNVYLFIYLLTGCSLFRQFPYKYNRK